GEARSSRSWFNCWTMELAAQAGKGKLLRQNLYEVVPGDAIKSSESYEFQAAIAATDDIDAVNEELPFAVVSPDAPAPEVE
ncbi:MAG: hypothetical protein LJE91_01245, partial [Gammaproteobacteria bacterium]|nr:hypothetical protein [Gammaproteobacteria bacterium]